MSNSKDNLENIVIEERWNIVLEIYQDYYNDETFSNFEQKYGPKLDNLEITANKYVGNLVSEDFEWNKKNKLEWFLGQFREICKDKRKTYRYMERILSVNRESNKFFFGAEKFEGRDLHSLFVQTDKERKGQVQYFKRKYSTKDGWHNSKSFPGELIYSDFKWHDRNSYESSKVALLMKSDKPNGLFQEIKGTVTTPYVPFDERGSVGAIFELELDNGERKEYNSNDIECIRVLEQSEETYHSIKSRLKKEGFVLYKKSSLIPANSDLAIIEGDLDSHSFSVNVYTMNEERNFGWGGLATFNVSNNGETEQLNMNDLRNVMYVKVPSKN